jgi:hypothetical protein
LYGSPSRLLLPSALNPLSTFSLSSSPPPRPMLSTLSVLASCREHGLHRCRTGWKWPPPRICLLPMGTGPTRLLREPREKAAWATASHAEHDAAEHPRASSSLDRVAGGGSWCPQLRSMWWAAAAMWTSRRWRWHRRWAWQVDVWIQNWWPSHWISSLVHLCSIAQVRGEMRALHLPHTQAPSSPCPTARLVCSHQSVHRLFIVLLSPCSCPWSSLASSSMLWWRWDAREICPLFLRRQR